MQRKQTSIKRRKANGIFNERRILLPYFASLIRALKQLVIPAKFRKLVLQTGHDSMFAGHLCRLKRYHIKSQFYWTGIISIVREYVQSCHVCQKMAEELLVRCAHVQESTLAFLPIQKIAINLVVEINPPSA